MDRLQIWKQGKRIDFWVFEFISSPAHHRIHPHLFNQTTTISIFGCFHGVPLYISLLQVRYTYTKKKQSKLRTESGKNEIKTEKKKAKIIKNLKAVANWFLKRHSFYLKGTNIVRMMNTKMRTYATRKWLFSTFSVLNFEEIVFLQIFLLNFRQQNTEPHTDRISNADILPNKNQNEEWKFI